MRARSVKHRDTTGCARSVCGLVKTEITGLMEVREVWPVRPRTKDGNGQHEIAKGLTL